jgi:uncharacterized protein
MTSVRMAAWKHVEGRRGFEVARLESGVDGGHRIAGHASGEDEGRAWGLRYALRVDASWATRSLELEGLSEEGPWALTLRSDGDGRWERDGAEAPELAGCADVDLASTVLTNLLPVRRLDLEVGASGTLDAVWISTPADREVQRLAQRYERIGMHLWRYASAGFEAEIEVDDFGLVVAYAGLARRVA